MIYNVKINGKKYEVEVERGGTAYSEKPAEKSTEKKAAETRTSAPDGSFIIRSPMPGSIADLKVSVGQQIKKGQVLMTLEAMKMENEILADRDGIVEGISVSKGENVNTGDALVALK